MEISIDLSRRYEVKAVGRVACQCVQEHETKTGRLLDEGGERSDFHWLDTQEWMHHALVFHLQRELHDQMALGG